MGYNKNKPFVKVDVTGEVDKRFDNVTSQLAQKATKINQNSQSYKRTYQSLGSDNKKDIFIRKQGSERYGVFIHHKEDVYQQWRLTKEDYVFDKSYPEHANGDPFLADTVHHTRLYNFEDNQVGIDDFKKVGTWSGTGLNSGENIYSNMTGDYVEYLFFGSAIRLRYLSASNAGEARVVIDGRSDLANGLSLNASGEAILDQYGTGSSQTIWLATGLSNIWHTIRIYVNGTKNVNSTDTRVYLDYFRTEYPVFENNNHSIEGIQTDSYAMPSGLNFFRQGSSAIEMAILNNLNGNTVWSGSVHRNAYLVNEPIFYLDGTPYSSEIDAWGYGKEVMLVQKIRLTNGTTDIAEVYLTHVFDADGLTVSWNLVWLVDITINNSYTAMYGTKSDRIKFGGEDSTIEMIQDTLEKGDVRTDHVIGWNTKDNYAVMLELLNYEADTNFYRDYDKAMFVWDRTQDAKIYAPKYKGDITAGTTWKSLFRVSIKHQNRINNVLS